jgi:transposase
MDMVIIGVDLHKRCHTAVAIDQAGRKLATKTADATAQGHLGLLAWADGYPARRWALEDCRNLSRRLEADLLRAGELVVRVPPKLMALARRSGREPGKSDPIDALAVARAALREPDLPVACLPGPEREVRLLIDHREDLIFTRTQIECRLRWHLHELGIEEPPARALGRLRVQAKLAQSLHGQSGIVARIARELVAQVATLSASIDALEAEIAGRVASLAPSLLALSGCGALTAAKIVGETAGASRFRSRAAFARYNGSAPVPVWSGNDSHHRLSRGGNRQLNAALHRIAVTQIRLDCAGSAYFQTRQDEHNDTKRKAIRALRRRISDEVYRRLRHDETARRGAGEPVAAAA